METMLGILIPFIGTSLGAAMVFILKREISENLQKILTGFAAGVMVAASFWSLLQPALESSEHLGTLSFVPAAAGFLIGMGFLLLLDTVTPHMHMDQQDEGPRSGLKRTTKLILAPVQVKVLPVSDKSMEYAEKVYKRLRDSRIRVELDDRNEKIGYKIRYARQEDKVCYMVIVGEKEVADNRISVRDRATDQTSTYTVEEFIEKIRQETAAFSGMQGIF